jgi:hypothetical protein
MSWLAAVGVHVFTLAHPPNMLPACSDNAHPRLGIFSYSFLRNHAPSVTSCKWLDKTRVHAILRFSNKTLLSTAPLFHRAFAPKR